MPREIKHTPGPWKWEGHALRPLNPEPNLHAIHTIFEVDHFAWGFAFSKLEPLLAEDEANRALIASAPELLEALTAAEEFISGFEDDQAQDGINEQLTAMRIVLSKARNAIASTQEPLCTPSL